MATAFKGLIILGVLCKATVRYGTCNAYFVSRQKYHKKGGLLSIQ